MVRATWAVQPRGRDSNSSLQDIAALTACKALTECCAEQCCSGLRLTPSSFLVLQQPGAPPGLSGNGAALRHFQAMGNKYPLAVKLGTITPHGADVYSYAPDEDDMVLDPKLVSNTALDATKDDVQCRGACQCQAVLGMWRLQSTPVTQYSAVLASSTRALRGAAAPGLQWGAGSSAGQPCR